MAASVRFILVCCVAFVVCQVHACMHRSFALINHLFCCLIDWLKALLPGHSK